MQLSLWALRPAIVETIFDGMCLLRVGVACQPKDGGGREGREKRIYECMRSVFGRASRYTYNLQVASLPMDVSNSNHHRTTLL